MVPELCKRKEKVGGVTPPECWISGGYGSPLRGARLKGSPRGGRHQPLLSESPTVFVHITFSSGQSLIWSKLFCKGACYLVAGVNLRFSAAREPGSRDDLPAAEFRGGAVKLDVPPVLGTVPMVFPVGTDARDVVICKMAVGAIIIDTFIGKTHRAGSASLLQSHFPIFVAVVDVGQQIIAVSEKGFVLPCILTGPVAGFVIDVLGIIYTHLIIGVMDTDVLPGGKIIAFDLIDVEAGRRTVGAVH